MKQSVRKRITRSCVICGAALALLASAAYGPAIASGDPSPRALDVVDAEAPRGAVGGFTSPARGTLQLVVSASDDGAGLTTATATIDAAPAGAARLGAAGCAALPPADPPAAGACPARVAAVTLAVDLTPYATGRHRLQVRVADAAGNTSLILDEALDVAGPAPVLTPSVTLQVGNGTGTGGGAASGAGGILPATTSGTAPACRAPRLSMALDQRPLRVTKAGVAVLRRGRRYRFRGRLTCRVGAGRRTAPAGVAVGHVDRLGPGGRYPVRKTGLTTRSSGRLTFIASYRSSRTLAFRYDAPDGASSRVRILIVVARAVTKAKTKTHARRGAAR